MKYILLAISAFSLPSIALSQTLCREGEIDYFSCTTTANGKIISVCGNISTDSDINDDSWLQYRFGKTGAIELTYPKEKRGSVQKFEGNYFSKYKVIDLRFINEKILYSVALNGSSGDVDASEKTTLSGGVRVQMSKVKSVNIGCQKVDEEKYFDIFSSLNALLRNYNGETDFLYKFYNHILK